MIHRYAKCFRFQIAKPFCSKLRVFLAVAILGTLLALVYREDLLSFANGVLHRKISWKSSTNDVILIPKRNSKQAMRKWMDVKEETATKMEEKMKNRKPNSIKKKRKTTRKGNLIPFSLDGREELYKNQKHTQCGTKWQENYIKLHRDVLSSRKPRKCIVYLCGGKGFGCGGYGNRLNAIASLLLLAILTDRAFLIDWNYSIALKDFLHPNRINWDYSVANLDGLTSQRDYWGIMKGVLSATNGTVRRPIRDHQKFSKWIENTDFRTYFDRPVAKVTTMWYFSDDLMQNRYLVGEFKKRGIGTFRRLSWIGCAFDFLFKKSKILETRLTEAREFIGMDKGNPVMGIHIRVGDRAFGKGTRTKGKNIRTKDYTRIIQCANATEKAILKANPGRMYRRMTWFLASDDARLKENLARKFPAIKMLDVKVEHIAYFRPKKNLPSSEGMIGVLLDHFLLSECDFLVLSRSSFGTTALGLRFHSSQTFTFGERCKY